MTGTSRPPLLELEHVDRWYPVGGRRRGRFVQAVTDVSLTIDPGETVGLIGESGCGKSTLGRTIVGLDPIRSGTIKVEGKIISGLSDRHLRVHRRYVQMVWQNAASAVNPRKRVDRIIREPLDVHRIGTPNERDQRVQDLVQLVSLRSEMAWRYPHELSGGQLQRVVIARALALEPKLLICDEPTASLDVSIRAQIVNLLFELKDRLGLGVLYISHDLRTVQVLCDRVLIMYLGRIVEELPSAALEDSAALHPYARALIASVPSPDPEQRRGEPPVLGEVPSALNPPSGCPYHPRCPLARPVCGEVFPDPTRIGESQWAACHAVGGPAHRQWSETEPEPLPV